MACYYNIKGASSLSSVSLDTDLVMQNVLGSMSSKLSRMATRIAQKVATKAKINDSVEALAILLFTLPAVAAVVLIVVLRQIYVKKQQVMCLLLEVPETAYGVMCQQCEKFIGFVTQNGDDLQESSRFSVDGEEAFDTLDFDTGIVLAATIR